MVYLYPEHLKAKPVLWFWTLKDVAIIGISGIGAVALAVRFNALLPFVFTALYSFLTIRIADISILDFMRDASRYFFGSRKRYEWRRTCLKRETDQRQSTVRRR